MDGVHHGTPSYIDGQARRLQNPATAARRQLQIQQDYLAADSLLMGLSERMVGPLKMTFRRLEIVVSVVPEPLERHKMK